MFDKINNCNYCVNGIIKKKQLDEGKCLLFLEQNGINTVHNGASTTYSASASALLHAKTPEERESLFCTIEQTCEDTECKFHPQCPRRREFLDSLKS